MPDVPSPSCGRLEVICGPMFSGKTTELIRRLRSSTGTGEVASICFKPVSDTRPGGASIRTHGGDSEPATEIDDPRDWRSAMQGRRGGLPRLVGFDEAHFFGTALVQPVRELLAIGARVIVAGVERDHRGRPFDPFPELLCEADEVLKLTARCARCGGVAVHSYRLSGGGDRIVVGGAESYEPRCRACFVGGR